MKKVGNTHTVDLVFVLALFAMFAISVLLVLLFGANSYKEIANRMEHQYEERTVLSYLTTKVHHYDEVGSVEVGAMEDGRSVLLLWETINDTRYVTSIYYDDGAVKEIYTEEGYTFSPEVGMNIISANDFTVEKVADHLIRLSCTGETGRQSEVYLHLRSEGGLQP